MPKIQISQDKLDGCDLMILKNIVKFNFNIDFIQTYK